jgi:hypothetical protein
MSYRPCERNQTLITMTRAIEQNDRLWMPPTSPAFVIHSVPNGGYARASYASGGGGTSRVPRIAGDVTAGPALVSYVLVSYTPCVERRRF